MDQRMIYILLYVNHFAKYSIDLVRWNSVLITRGSERLIHQSERWIFSNKRT